MSAEEAERGEAAAYGLRLVGVAAPGVAGEETRGWEAWTVRRVIEAGQELDGEEMTVWEDRAVIPMPQRGRIDVDRGRREVLFTINRPISDEALLHPGIVPVAAVVNAWLGRACLHASAVLLGGAVWALLADRGGGKSTTAALLSARGHRVFADDMLIVDGGRCFAGPPSIDLRPDASERLGGEFLGVIGQRERWRLEIERAVAEAPLGGFVELGWTDGPPRVEPIGLADRLEMIGRQASMPIPGERLLELASLPALRFERAHDLAGADAALALLEQATS